MQPVSSSEDLLSQPSNSLCDYALRCAIGVLFVDNWIDFIGRGGSTALLFLNETVAFCSQFVQPSGRFIFNVTPCLKYFAYFWSQDNSTYIHILRYHTMRILFASSVR